jgi:hypothetical protein
VVTWDCGVTDLDSFGIHGGALIFDVESYADSDVEFDYSTFKREIRAKQE